MLGDAVKRAKIQRTTSNGGIGREVKNGGVQPKRPLSALYVLRRSQHAQERTMTLRP